MPVMFERDEVTKQFLYCTTARERRRQQTMKKRWGDGETGRWGDGEMWCCGVVDGGPAKQNDGWMMQHSTYSTVRTTQHCTALHSTAPHYQRSLSLLQRCSRLRQVAELSIRGAPRACYRPFSDLPAISRYELGSFCPDARRSGDQYLGGWKGHGHWHWHGMEIDVDDDDDIDIDDVKTSTRGNLLDICVYICIYIYIYHHTIFFFS
jgi:hypothetical protein